MASSARRNWDALEGKIVPPDRWREFTVYERKVFCLLRQTPPPSIREIADELDLSGPEVERMIDAKDMRAAEPARRVPVGTFLKLVETAAERVLLAMDQKRVDTANLRDLSTTLRDLINSRALLLGEPTQIIGSDHRRQMNDLVQMMLSEARRRGISFEHDSNTGQVITRRPVAIDASGRPA